MSVGTAWATYKGYLVTASHVISGGSQIAVYRDGELLGKAKVVANDPASDIAVLKFIPDHPAPLDALRLAEGPSELGESVFTLGYPAPDLLGQQIKMTSGDVSSTAGINDNARLLQMSVPVQPGNSGGPVMGWDGAVIGVADASVPFIGDEALAQNVNYAVKSAYVRAMLEDLPDLGGYAYIKTAGGHDSLVAAARKAVFMLVVRQ